MAWEKQQKEMERQQEIIDRLSGGANTGRASMAEKVSAAKASIRIGLLYR